MTKLNKESVDATRQWFHDNALACIAEMDSGEVRVNNPEAYRAQRTQDAQDFLAGKWDHTLTFQQRATWIQTGECHALLP